jgi:hypothetical protein
MSDPTAHPLTWPPGFPRTKLRQASRFSTTLPKALGNVQASLRLFAKESERELANVVISSNVTLGADRPADSGVALWFRWDEMPICIAIDRYKTVEENLQAIHHIIEARRTELRHGTLHLVRATFTGFKALAPPKGEGWRDILKLNGVNNIDSAAIEQAYKAQAREVHPDRGGSATDMAKLNAARVTALLEIGA